jgi:uncharacterized membrane protein YfcA
MLGGLLGGLLLLAISNQTFMGLVPWLLLVATSLFAFSAQISRLIQTLRTKLSLSARASPGSAGGAVFQLGVAIYGGFFGAGMGILTLAALSIQGFEDLQEINALKNLTSAMNYTVAAATFILAGAISWPHTLLALVTAAVGSVVGSALARRMSNRWLKRLVILVGASLSLIYFIKTA